MKKKVFYLAIINLQQQAFNFAQQLLKPNGYFLCKLFQGQESFQEMRLLLQSYFNIIHLVKPSASRSESSEIYLLAMQYNGQTISNGEKLKNNSKQNEMEKLLEEARRVRTKKK